MIRHDKLVRDLIPAIIRAEGKTCATRTLSDSEFLGELIRKLREETLELETSMNAEEAADLLEVVLAIGSRLAGGPERFEAIRAAKAGKRGAFVERIYLEYVE